jgi:multidrug resistance efflux pump
MALRLVQVSLLLTSALLLSACGGIGAAPTPQPELTTEPERTLIIADGRVLPNRHAELRFERPGSVSEVLVQAGQYVTAGTALARIDSATLEVAVVQAEALLAEASAQYELLRTGATAEAVAIAEAQVAQAQALAQQSEGRITPTDLQAARDELREAQALLERLQSGPRSSEIAQLEAALSQAQSNLQSQRDLLSATKSSAELRLEQVANVLRDAQDAYSRIYWDNRELEELPDDLPQERKDLEATALRAVATQESALEQARVALEQARLAEQSGVVQAEAQVREVQARLDQLRAGAEPDQLAAARARVTAAQARIVQLSGLARSGELAAAEAQVAQAEAGLAELTAPPQPPALAAAEARVQIARAALRQAELALDEATLRTPFDATVVAINLELGVQPPTTEPALILADFSSWKIETSDLSELDVVAVEEGELVQISFDALPELSLEGEVSRVEALGKSYQGDVIFVVTLLPRSWDARLRWNMTATITFNSDRPE